MVHQACSRTELLVTSLLGRALGQRGCRLVRGVHHASAVDAADLAADLHRGAAKVDLQLLARCRLVAHRGQRLRAHPAGQRLDRPLHGAQAHLNAQLTLQVLTARRRRCLGGGSAVRPATRGAARVRCTARSRPSTASRRAPSTRASLIEDRGKAPIPGQAGLFADSQDGPGGIE